MRSSPSVEMTSSTSPVVWYSGVACMTHTFATFGVRQLPASRLGAKGGRVVAKEMKVALELRPCTLGPPSGAEGASWAWIAAASLASAVRVMR